ncbi:RNA polymerase factor sigma-54 [Thermomonas carbonis]|uniref:RNA polymerase sigma-54 factor n=1 Tax=Thermomonas carbonis TaxID=1463158 RepID=A0A7G9SR62_9GAMM|nr:RNA polymerase factor sigma-54 [Thermomonas carbonis]QNN70337.1 RNA polymerase factor sigma-54 [Thermomonas carbonis]
MKQRLSPALQQHLVLTPQLRQAIRLLQLSTVELEAEVAEAVASNPLLDWAEDGEATPGEAHEAREIEAPVDTTVHAAEAEDHWDREAEPWQERIGPSSDRGDDEIEHPAAAESLRDHLLFQLHLGHFSQRDASIGVALIDAIDDDGYLREDLEELARSLRPEIDAGLDELLQVLHRIQQFDPVGVGARDLGECLRLQLRALPVDTAGRDVAMLVTAGPLQRLPKIGIDGVCHELRCERGEAEAAVHLLRSLDPRPGSQHGELPAGTYLTPDCVIWRQQGLWRVALAAGAMPRVAIQHGYEQMIRHASNSDADYLRGRLQEARWLLKGLESRADTLLRVVRCLVREQAAFLEFGEQALHPLTLRSIAAELGLHESTVSRAIARKYVRTPRGTIPLRDFFASGIETEGGGSASSTAIQDMIRKLVAAEDPRKPLSDARLADTLKADGVPVARRTVAKYREALHIPASHERVRIG